MAKNRGTNQETKGRGKKVGRWGKDSQYLGVRLAPDLLEQIEKAASIKGWKVGDLVRIAAVEKAAAILNTSGDSGSVLRTIAAYFLEHFEKDRPEVVERCLEPSFERDLEYGPIASIVINTLTDTVDIQQVEPERYVSADGDSLVPAKHPFAPPKTGADLVILRRVPGSDTLSPSADQADHTWKKELNLQVPKVDPDMITALIRVMRLAGSDWARIWEEERRRLAGAKSQSEAPALIDPARLLADAPSGDADDAQTNT